MRDVIRRKSVAKTNREQKIYHANIASVKYKSVSEMWWNLADCVVWQVKWRVSSITNCQYLSWNLPQK